MPPLAIEKNLKMNCACHSCCFPTRRLITATTNFWPLFVLLFSILLFRTFSCDFFGQLVPCGKSPSVMHFKLFHRMNIPFQWWNVGEVKKLQRNTFVFIYYPTLLGQQRYIQSAFIEIVFCVFGTSTHFCLHFIWIIALQMGSKNLETIAYVGNELKSFMIFFFDTHFFPLKISFSRNLIFIHILREHCVFFSFFFLLNHLLEKNVIPFRSVFKSCDDCQCIETQCKLV